MANLVSCGRRLWVRAARVFVAVVVAEGVCMRRLLIILPLDARVGTIDVAIPKLRSGTYFPEWLLQRRKRSENALITVVADCYLAGVSTRRMDKLVKTLGITGLSKSQVSRMATDLDEHVEQFRNRPLDDAGPFTFVAADALTMKVLAWIIVHGEQRYRCAA